MLREFFIFRHGETDWNLQKRIQGHTDIPLNASGVSQSLELVNKILPFSPEIIYSSDLIRAKQTAKPLAEKLGIEIIESSCLREAHFGEAEGKLGEEIVGLYGEDLWEGFMTLSDEFLDVCFPGGESKGDAIRRIKAFIETLIEETSFQKIAISTHGGALRNLLYAFFPEECRGQILVPNCSLFHLTFNMKDSKWQKKGPL